MELWGILDNSIEELRYVEGYIIGNANDTIAAIVKSIRNSDRSLNKKLSAFIQEEPNQTISLEAEQAIEEVLQEVPIEPQPQPLDNPFIPDPQPPLDPIDPGTNPPPSDPIPPTEPPVKPPTEPLPPTQPPTVPPIQPLPPGFTPQCTSVPTTYSGVFPQTQMDMSYNWIGITQYQTNWINDLVTFATGKRSYEYVADTHTIDGYDAYLYSGGVAQTCLTTVVSLPYHRNRLSHLSAYTDETQNFIHERFGINDIWDNGNRLNNFDEYCSTRIGFYSFQGVNIEFEDWSFIPPTQPPQG